MTVKPEMNRHLRIHKPIRRILAATRRDEPAKRANPHIFASESERFAPRGGRPRGCCAANVERKTRPARLGRRAVETASHPGVRPRPRGVLCVRGGTAAGRMRRPQPVDRPNQCLDGENQPWLRPVAGSDAVARQRVDHPKRWKDRKFHYGTDELVEAVQRAAGRVRASDRRATLGVADFSRLTGGSSIWHSSHHSGRDVDLIFYHSNSRGKPVKPPQTG